MHKKFINGYENEEQIKSEKNRIHDVLAQRRYVYAVKYSAIIIIKTQRIYRRHV